MSALAGHRITTPLGTMLIAAHSRDPFRGDGAALFTPQYWQASGRLSRTPRGRGSSWFLAGDGFEWALRHYQRGGWLAALMPMDHYLWRGEGRVRSFAEWRLLRHMIRHGLPVPEPVAAFYRRSGLTYSCDLITRRIAAARPLSDALGDDRLAPGLWRELGATVARFHAAGIDHADLTAHNILVGDGGRFSIVDFDRGRIRPPGSWIDGNLRRLLRSMHKVAATLPAGRFTPADWQELLAGHAQRRAGDGGGAH